MKQNRSDNQPIRFKDLLDTLGVPEEPNFPGEGFEVIVSYLESEDEGFKIAPYMKAAGNVVLGIGVVPSLSKGENAFVAAMDNAACFQRNVDGCVLLNEDKILQNIELGNLNIDVDGWIDEEMVNPIQNAITEMLTPGIPNISSDNLRDVLRDCVTFMLSHGVGEGTLRIEAAWRNAFDSVLPIIAHFDGKKARKMIIKVLVASDDNVLNQEIGKIRALLCNLSPQADIILGVGHSQSLTSGQLEIVIMATGFEPAF